MPKKFSWLLSALTICGVFAQPAHSQQQPPSTKPDSPEVQAHIEKAKKIAGTYWAQAEHFLCEAPRANQATDPGPVKLFDNFWAIPGSYSVGNAVTYVLPSSAGIMLIDPGHAKDVETQLLPGLKTLGLDPANIKVVILAHGHEDHFGGSAYLQQHYGAHVYMTAADWDFINIPRPPAAGGNAAANAAPPVPLPKKDMVAFEGVPITLGDQSVTPVFIPGHTPGSLGLIIPVKDNGKPHVVGMVGGGFIAQGNASQVQEFIDSIAHFEDWTRRMKVDVEIQNHPVFDGFADKLTALRARKPGEPNPFVVGQENYTRFLDLMMECARATRDRQKD
jgi:metallo-beta-lactamase class B